MDKLKLIRPNKTFETATLDYKKEHFDHHESIIYGSAFLDKKERYSDWLEQLENNSNEQTLTPDWVVSSTFFILRERDQRIVGIIDIRHSLNDFLRQSGGHMGYSIRPTERQKGYATKALTLGLEFCKSINLSKVMLTCYKDNIASAKTILKCGGVFDHECIDISGKTVHVYWIEL
ncbi:MAG: GNAT family N-acetyltransferase [Eubacterium sp.]